MSSVSFIDKLILAGGSVPNGQDNAPEVINLDKQDQTCSKLPNLPQTFIGSSGAVLTGNNPLVCGGKIYLNFPSRNCYLLKSEQVEARLSFGR